jgi:hypothetical protein
VNSTISLIALVFGAAAIAELIVIALLVRRVEGLQDRVARAVRAAEDAARAAALASPGGIDPEVVISLLRTGMPVTLDAVYARMREEEAEVTSE